MSNPNPLIPQGSFQAQSAKGASNVRIAVATIVAIHVVFFGGLLLQGCKRDAKLAGTSETNATPSNLTLPPIDSGNLFYTNVNNLPTETTSTRTNASTSAAGEPSTPGTATDPWKPTNLGATGNLTPQEQPLVPGKDYSVVRGDNYHKIAAANGITVSALRKANPNIDPAKIRPGMKLQIPAPAAQSVQTSASTTSDGTGGAAAGNSYTVKPGDTLTKVAKAHNVTMSQLRAANNLKTSGLRVGQKLKIPPPSQPGETPKATNSTAKAHSKSSSTSPVH